MSQKIEVFGGVYRRCTPRWRIIRTYTQEGGKFMYVWEGKLMSQKI